MNLLFAILFATLLPCPTEDSINCAWDAQLRGNHQGTSFVNINGEVYPVR